MLHKSCGVHHVNVDVKVGVAEVACSCSMMITSQVRVYYCHVMLRHVFHCRSRLDNDSNDYVCQGPRLCDESRAPVVLTVTVRPSRT